MSYQPAYNRKEGFNSISSGKNILNEFDSSPDFEINEETGKPVCPGCGDPVPLMDSLWDEENQVYRHVGCDPE